MFLKAGAFAVLEEKREVMIDNWVLKLQTASRGFLSRMRLQRLLVSFNQSFVIVFPLFSHCISNIVKRKPSVGPSLHCTSLHKKTV